MRLLWLVTLLVAMACNTRTPDWWKVPADFTGWVVVRYEDPACERLPIRDGYRELSLSPRGRLCTSDRHLGGDAFDRWNYISPDGRTTSIDQRTTVWGGYYSSTKLRFKFVGTEAAYRKSLVLDLPTLEDLCRADPGC